MASIAYSVVDLFEKTIAKYCGSRFAVAVESGTAALLLCCAYKKVIKVRIPRYTYPSVPCSIIHAGGSVEFQDKKWTGMYELEPYNIWDCALRFKKDMYIEDSMMCLSFHAKKQIPIGRGGMILLDDEEAYNWLKKARFDGRDELPLDQDEITMIGWNAYMTPEQAARGLQLFDMIKTKDLPDLTVESQNYQDLTKYGIYED